LARPSFIPTFVATCHETNEALRMSTVLKVKRAFVTVTASRAMVTMLKERVSMVSARHSCTIITAAKVMSVRHTIEIKDTGGAIFVLSVLVEPVVRLKMAKGYPVCLSLKTWVMGDSLFDSMLMITLQTVPRRHLTLILLELVSQPLLCVIVRLDVFLIGLANQLFRIPSVVRV
jgi:hypothetical protein